jgi:peptidoglycan/LPS O-acetylase OafA/YrhL
MATHPPRPAVHLPQLDALRGIAAFFVFAFHVTAVYGWDQPEAGRAILRGLWETHSMAYRLLSPLSLGWMGVELFFVLSGFCIHLGFARKREPLVPGDYFSRRFWRIYPAYLLVMLAVETFRCNVHWIRWWVEKRTIVFHLLMIHNLSKPLFFDIDGPFWSLAYEWQYYCLYPLFLIAHRSIGMGKLLGVVSVVGIGSYFLPTGGVFAFQSVFHGCQLYVLWCIGAWLAERFVAGKPALVNPLIVGIVMIPLIMGGWPFKDLCAGLFAASVLDWVVRRPMGRWGRVMVPLGMISYSFYLLHYPIMVELWRFLFIADHPAYSYARIFAAVLPATVLLAWINFRIAEMPGIRLGGYLRRRSAANRMSIAAAQSNAQGNEQANAKAPSHVGV